MRRAFAILRTGRYDPVIIALPESGGQYEETAAPYQPVKGWKSQPDPADVGTAVELLDAADVENPVPALTECVGNASAGHRCVQVWSVAARYLVY